MAIETTGWVDTPFLWCLSDLSYSIRSLEIQVQDNSGDAVIYDDQPDSSGFYPTVGKFWKPIYLQLGRFEVVDIVAGTYKPLLGPTHKIEYFFNYLEFPESSGFNCVNVFLRADQEISLKATCFNNFDFQSSIQNLDFSKL
jgi:hypothetical protein